MSRKNLLPVVLIPSVILLLPGAAMWFKVDGWGWSPADFVVMWSLIAGVVLTYRLVAARATSWSYRAAVGVGLATGFFLIWINGAVGLIGSEENPANVLYAGVLAVGAIGAAWARLAAPGMARALFATAAAQFLVPVAAVIFWPADFSPGVAPVFALNLVFVLLFATAGILFRVAGGRTGATGVPSPA